MSGAPVLHGADVAGGAPQALTVGERLLWMGQQLEPDAPLYNMALAIELAGPIDSDAFARAFQRLVDETDALRSSFVADGDTVRRVVQAARPAPVEQLRWLEGEWDDAAVAAALEARTQRTFALDGALFDCALIERRTDRFVWYLNQHHLITDAWSVGVLHRRLAALYAAATGGDAAVEASADTRFPQFAAYAEQQRSLEGSERLGRALAHWDAGRAAAPPAPSFYGRSDPGSGRTVRVRLRLDAARTAALRAVAGAAPFRGLTREQSHFQLFATLVLAWVHRLSDAPALAIGTPWHNRTTAALRDTAGLFVELFPLGATIGEGESFASLGRAVAASTREAMRHVVPGASRSPGARTFGVVLNYITARLGDFAGAPVRADWIHSGFGDREHRVRVQVHDFDLAGEPIVDLDLDAGIFGAAERTWAARDLLALFDALVAAPDTAIAAVGLPSADDLTAFAPPGATAPAPATVLELVHAARHAAPGAIAIRDGERTMTYDALHEAAQRLARQLRSQGVGPEVVVGIALDRSSALIVAMLATLEAGGAFVPLDPAHPDERLAWVAGDAGAALVLTSGVLAPRVRGWGATPLVVDVEASDGSHLATDPIDTPPSRDTLAYVLYTSGSTGRPKGVEVTHGALADYVAWAARRYSDGAALAWPLFTSPAFDLTLTSILVPLASGGTIVVYRGDEGEGALLVRRVFEENAVDVVKLTPSHLALVRDLDLSHSRLRRLVIGGEELTRATALAVHDALGGRAELLNEYGPTEATVACMLHRFDPASDTRRSVPIGRPAENAQILVLSPDGAPVPRGVRGEICVGGPRLARGYRGRPELTARAFVSHPAAVGGRVYRTGDLGRWLPDGTLEYLGRGDTQVKVRGVRVELGEIEDALARHPSVERCVAHLAVAARGGEAPRCRVCGLEGTHPDAQLDADHRCAVCRRFEDERANVERYFGTMDDLRTILAEARTSASGAHDCLMLFSGGKDSTYALSRIVELGARPLVMLFDNGFISEQAKGNVRRVVETLGLELVVATVPSMPAIFAESLARFSNVCNGCYKAIYTVAMQLAVDRGIRHIVTGLSRGQIFETRLADLYRRGVYEPDEVDRIILEARKAYHRMDDVVAQTLDVRLFETDAVLERIRFVDFYRYSDASLDEILAHVAARTPWIRPTDTGRSTNCLINQAGIYVHQMERGFHNYAMPYSWDVRLGHKARDAAVAELDDALDEGEIAAMLQQVGYQPRRATPDELRLVAYYTAPAPLAPAELRGFLEATLPREMIPSAFVHLEAIPLAVSGKVDRAALPQPSPQRASATASTVAPRTPAEATLAELWSEVLNVRPIGVDDDFFALGGDSMQCIQIVAAARARGLAFAPRDLFRHPTIAGLASVATRIDLVTPVRAASASASELAELLDEFDGEFDGEFGDDREAPPA